MTHNTNTATVQTLTAEVRTLTVGSKQVTLSIFKQLDYVTPWRINAFGRVNAGGKYDGEPVELELVGSDDDGCLVSSHIMSRTQIIDPVNRHILYLPGRYANTPKTESIKRRYRELEPEWTAMLSRFYALPLIVLAGLK
jgi:hypothetical protein